MGSEEGDLGSCLFSSFSLLLSVDVMCNCEADGSLSCIFCFHVLVMWASGTSPVSEWTRVSVCPISSYAACLVQQ